MGFDNPGGPGKGPETSDKPTPPSTGEQPPATSGTETGSRTPRLDSYRAAGVEFPGRPKNGTEQGGEQGNEQGGDRDQGTDEGTSTDPPADNKVGTEDQEKKGSETGESETESPTGDGESEDGAPRNGAPQDGTAKTTDVGERDPEPGELPPAPGAEAPEKA
ncbi:hypothetical protein E1293_42380, partial [Actinomadura darangshiensis]